MVAPDPEYSRPDAPFARFDRLEYLVPESELGALLWSLFEARADLLQIPRINPLREIPVYGASR